MARILVVEDHLELAASLRTILGAEGYEVETVGDGVEALGILESQAFDLITLDLMLPGLDGYQVLKEIRKQAKDTAVLMLTARGEELDRVQGLKLGADDYMVKPFSVLELLERIKAILRRAKPRQPQVLVSGPLRVERENMTIMLHGQPIDLSSTQFRLLELLLQHAGTTLSRTEILRHLWPPESQPSGRAVDIHVARIRKRLEDAEMVGCIRTVSANGYRWIFPVTHF